jgi:serine/threonine protein kinase
MLTYEGAVKLLDFGVARAETGRNATVTGVVKGKFAYMSPEQISGTLIDHRSDIYSMGIVMFECLASRRLYKGETPQEIASMIIENRPPRLSTIVPDIDPVLDAICAKALSFSAKDRFSDAEEMAEVLDEYLQKSKSRSNFISLREVVEDRFDAQYARRKQLVEAIRKGTYDERELMEVFSARPVLDLDFQSNDVAIENGGVSKEALRVPFAVDETISNESGISLAEEAQTLGMIRPVEQLVDIEDTIATTLGDGIRSADTSLPLLKEPQGRPLIEKTVPHIETLDPEFEIRATVAAAQIEGAPPKPSVSTNETSRYSPSVSSRQTYTLGVVLTALLLGCCLGTAIGLYLARSLGI